MPDPDRSQAETAEERALAMLNDAARPASANRDRVNAAMIDLFRPEGYRLSDRQRTIMRRLLDRLLETIETGLRSRLLADQDCPPSPEFRAALDSSRVAIARPILERSGVLRNDDLVAALLRRADEYRVMRQLRKDAIATSEDALDSLIEDPDGDLAQAAMALLVAESHRNDRFDDPILPVFDLPFDVRGALVWWVAAALRQYGVIEHRIDGIGLDGVVERVGQEYLASESDERPLDKRSGDLAELLHAADRATDRMILSALNAARLSLYVALLAKRAALAFDEVWAGAVEAGAGHHALLLRLARIDREAAAHLLMAMSRANDLDSAGGEPIADAMAIFDAISPEKAGQLLRPILLDSGYRSALGDVASGSKGSVS